MAETTLDRSLTDKQQKAFETKVKESLWAYQEIPTKLRERVRQYLVDGEDATCLLELDAAYQAKGRKAFFKTQHGMVEAANKEDRRKLRGLVDISEAPAGYFQRLGEVAGRVPEVKNFRLESDDRVPQWLRDLLSLRSLLSGRYLGFFYSTSSKEGGFQIAPYLADIEDRQVMAQIVAMMVDLEPTYATMNRHMATACDWGDVLKDYPEELAAGLTAANANSREAALTWLNDQNYDYEPIIPTILELAVGPSKKVRPLALNILRNFPEQSGTLLTESLQSGGAAQRGFAAEALAALQGKDAVPVLRAAAKEEKAARVKQTIESLLETLEQAEQEDSAAEAFDLPPIEMPTEKVPLPEGFAKSFAAQLEAAFDKLDEQYQKQKEAYNKPDRPHWMSKPQKPQRLSAKELQKAFQFLEEGEKRPQINNWTQQAIHQIPIWSKWIDPSKLHLLHVVRFLTIFKIINRYHTSEIVFNREDWLEAHRAAQSSPYGLRELDAAFATMNSFEPGIVAETYLINNNAWRSTLDWEADAVWPLFAEYLPIFRDAILGVSKHQGDYWVSERRRNAFRIAAMMPKLPLEIENAMWSVALGEGKADRPAARRALHAANNRVERAIAAIQDGKQGIRIAGAEMLGELGDPAAVEPLKKALKKEKQELVKGVMLQAIELLGGDVEEFLGRRKQLADAKKGLEKKRPKGMEWVPLDSLPTVRWADDNKPVAEEIVRWWVIQSIQFKLTTCGAVLRRSLGMCRPDDASTLAKYLLSAWIAYDTKTPTREDIIAEATKRAKQMWNHKHAVWVKDYYKTEDNYRDQLALEMQSQFLQSAIGQKGLLAIVSAAGNAECVKMIEKYIRTYHGHRLAQSKSLLETLAWIEDKSAIQVLLSLANRFRTKAIRKRAEEMVSEMADRQGWTMDQLADRTIPDAGFAREQDEEGNPIGDQAELVLDYGSRKFSVSLGDDLQAVITRDDGKQVKSLPAAAKDDDPEMVKAAKKEFSSAKKTIKDVVKTQAERLYEAACVQRSWPAGEWRQYLAEHPIAGALCRRVVWAAQGPQQTDFRLFRPLEDGTLTDVNDDEFTLEEDDQVYVAHSSLLDEETEEAWKQHLEDYEVPQLFKQFGRETYRLPESKQDETELTDYQGHMLTTYRLRSRATKLGWVRGDAEDGGSFGIYRKPFRSEGVEAVVEFTGSYLPEEDIPAAIRSLYFTPIKPNDSSYSWNTSMIKLGKVPAVLISECYNDVKEMAAEGTGFDPEWEKKGLW